MSSEQITMNIVQ